MEILALGRQPVTDAQQERKVEPLAKLLQARTQLANLMTYKDGKAGAHELLARAINDPALLQSLASAPKPAEEGAGTAPSGEES